VDQLPSIMSIRRQKVWWVAHFAFLQSWLKAEAGCQHTGGQLGYAYMPDVIRIALLKSFFVLRTVCNVFVVSIWRIVVQEQTFDGPRFFHILLLYKLTRALHSAYEIEHYIAIHDVLDVLAAIPNAISGRLCRKL
jgi:hypothetical protein